MNTLRTKVSLAILFVLNAGLVAMVIGLQIKDAENQFINAAMRQPFKPINFTMDVEGFTFVGESSNVLDLHVMYFGAYEKDILHFLRDVSRRLTPGGGVFIDVGANKGQHSLFMSRHAKEIHAYEPYAPVLAPFREMLALNQVSNVHIHAIGLGDKQENLTFFDPPGGNPGVGSFVRPHFETDGAPPTEKLPIDTGDHALAEAGVQHVDLIKLDVEGYERPALAGLRATLERDRPVVEFEVSVDPAVDTYFGSLDQIRAAFPAGYRLLRFETDRARLLSGEYLLEPVDIRFGHKEAYNLVAYPEEKGHLVPTTPAAAR